jgi:hypothetical protein
MTQVKHDGWYEGAGLAPRSEAITLIAEKFIAHYPESAPLPSIVPTQDGNLLAEWDALGDPSVDIHLSTLTACFHAFGEDAPDVKQDFLLSSETHWTDFFVFLVTTPPPMKQHSNNTFTYVIPEKARIQTALDSRLRGNDVGE